MKSRKSKSRQPPEEMVTRAIVQAQNFIRKKSQSLKIGQSEKDDMLEKSFAPIIGPLKQLVEESQPREEPTPEPVAATPKVPVKRKLDETVSHPAPQKRIKISDSARVPSVAGHSRVQPSDDDNDDVFTQPGPMDIDSVTPQRLRGGPPRGRFLTDVVEQPQSQEEVWVSPARHTSEPAPGLLETPEQQMLALKVINRNFGPVTRKAFMTWLLKKEKMDQVYGPDMAEGQWTMGNKNLRITAEDQLVLLDPHKKSDVKTFEATPGLLGLILYRTPVSWQPSDLRHYKEILDYTSVHRRSFDPKAQLKGNPGNKYKRIISPLFINETAMVADDDEEDGGSGEEATVAKERNGKGKKNLVGVCPPQ